MTAKPIAPPAHRFNNFAQAAASQAAQDILDSRRWLPWFDAAFLHIVAQHGRISAEGRERLDGLAGRPVGSDRRMING